MTTKTIKETVLLQMFAATLVNVKGVTDVLELGQTMVDMGVDRILPKGFWILDPKTGVEFYSPNYRVFFEYEGEHDYPSVMESWQKHINAADCAKAMRDYELVVETKGEHPYYNKVRYKTKTNKEVSVICTGEMDFDKEGNPIRMIGIHL